MVVPKIIHQIWIYQDSTKNISWAKKNFSESINSWKSKHPDFDYILWSNSEVHQLIHDYFPEIIPKINQIKSEDIIILADIARLCVLYIYGGIYSDLDIVAHRNYSELLMSNKILFPKTDPYGFSNDLIISPKKNFTINNFIQNITIKNYMPNRGLRVLYTCGPLYISEQLFKNINNFDVIPKEYYQGHLEGSTWLTKNDHHIKNFLVEIYNIPELKLLKNELKKKDLVRFYEYVDIFYIILIFYNINYLKSYYVFRLLDVFKCSSGNQIKQLNTIIHSIYRLTNVYLMKEKSEMYKWLRDLSLVSFTEMKSININSKIKKLINIYVLTKHIYLIYKSLIKKKKVYKNIKNEKFLFIHLSESILHFYLLTDRNKMLN